MIRRKIIIGNWKLNMTLREVKSFFDKFNELRKDQNIVIDYSLAPTFPLLYFIEKNNLPIVAQNCYFKDIGAFTGEVSPLILKSLNTKFVILGHSERRRIFNETNEIINQKIHAVFKHKMIPILCIGEDLNEFEAKKTKKVCKEQLLTAIKNVSKNDLKNIIIAYEPIWAIGTGKTATAQIAQDVCKFIRETLIQIASLEVANQIRIQYGGSVKPENIKELMSQPDIDGALVGGASLDPHSFFKLITCKVE